VDWSRLNSVQALLKHGADPNLQDVNQDTPLHRIPQQCTDANQCSSILKAVLQYGANAGAVNKYGRAALSHIDVSTIH
jgi:ankyrin repeat protein